jgi:integrase-like protein
VPACEGPIEAWRIDYNTVQPHRSLGGRTPEQFAARSGVLESQGSRVSTLTCFLPWYPVSTGVIFTIAACSLSN